MAIKLLNIFRKKPAAEKKILKEIETTKKANHTGNPSDAMIGGNWISKESGIYKLSYKKKGRLMTLSDLHKTENYTSANPAELKLLLEKAIGYSKTFNCEMIILKTWIFAKYPELKKLGFKEIRENSEKEFLEKIKKRKTTDENMLKLGQDDKFPVYYLNLK